MFKIYDSRTGKIRYCGDHEAVYYYLCDTVGTSHITAAEAQSWCEMACIGDEAEFEFGDGEQLMIYVEEDD